MRHLPVKTFVLIVAAFFAVVAFGLLARCAQLSMVLGGPEYGDFNQYAWIGKSEFADWPTGERPLYTYVSAWWVGFGAMAIAVFLLWFSTRLRGHENTG